MTLFRNTNDDEISMDLLVVGEDLHTKICVSSDLARRHALFYNVDISNVEPCFSLPDPNISGKFRETAITEKDVDKYLEKGGNYYCLLEMPNDEIKFRIKNSKDLNEAMEAKLAVIKLYKVAVKEYFKHVNNREEIYSDLILKRRLNPLTLNVYIEKVNNANVTRGQLNNFTDTLNILPDFLDVQWPYIKKKIEYEFTERLVNIIKKEKKKEEEEEEEEEEEDKTKNKKEKEKNKKEKEKQKEKEKRNALENFLKTSDISFEKFLNGEKRNLYINVLKPTGFLKM